MWADGLIQRLKMPEDAEKEPEKGVSETCQNLSEQEEILSEVVEMLSDTQKNLSGSKREVDHNIPKMPDWEHKALSKAQFDRNFDALPVILTLSVGGVAVASTISGMDPKVQVASYIMMLILFLVSNPLGMVERLLAIPSRLTLAMALMMVEASIIYPDKNMILATVIVSLIVGTIIMIGNRGWLIKEIYLATEFTRKAQRDDVEDLPYLSWRAHGKSELWTTLEQLGLTVTENELNYGYKKAWRLGYLHGMTMVETKNVKTEGLKNRIQELEEEMEMICEEIQEKDDQIDNLTKELDDRSDLTDRQNEKMKDLLEQLRDEKSTTAWLQDQNKKIRNELQEAKEIISEFEEQGGSDEAVEDLVKRMLEAGITYRQIESVTGWNSYRTGKVKEKYGIDVAKKAS